MPRKVTTKKKVESPIELPAQIIPETSGLSKKTLLTPKNIILLVILILVVVFWKFKGVFIAAMVNGQPISRWQLNNQLQKRFGDQVLDNIINERLILAGARQKGIFITADEIDKRVKEIEGRLKNQMSLNDALKAQGLSMEDFRQQIEIQLSIDKMFDKEATVSSEDVDNYLEKNSDYYKEATDPAKVKEDVLNILRQQKITELFDKWFSEIRESAKVQKYL